MEFLKSLVNAVVSVVVGAARIAYAVIARPFVNLINIGSMNKWEIAVSLMEVVSRTLIIASYFFAVPAFLVWLSWVWVVTFAIIFPAIAIVFVMVTVGAGFSALIGSAFKARQKADGTANAYEAMADFEKATAEFSAANAVPV